MRSLQGLDELPEIAAIRIHGVIREVAFKSERPEKLVDGIIHVLEDPACGGRRQTLTGW